MRTFILLLILLVGWYNNVSNTVPDKPTRTTIINIENSLPTVLEDSLRTKLANYIFLWSDPIPPKVIVSIIHIESNGDINATGIAGEQGLMQIYPKFWKDKFISCGENLYDPITNICYGINILKLHYSETNDLKQTIQLYNGTLKNTDYLNNVLLNLVELSLKEG